MSEPKSNAAVEAIKFALTDGDHGMRFLHRWLHGDFDVIRREWPECPAAVFEGAELAPSFPLLKRIPTQET